MVQAMDQWTSKETMDDTSDGSGSNPRSDGKCKQGMREESKERWMVKALNQWASEETMGGMRRFWKCNRLLKILRSRSLIFKTPAPASHSTV